MSREPTAGESKAICRPSGDQRGMPTCGPPKEVSWTGSEPSASQVQISRGPVREDEKATFFPSGEYWGLLSVRVEEINFVGSRSPAPFAPRTSMRQMFVSEWTEV